MTKFDFQYFDKFVFSLIYQNNLYHKSYSCIMTIHHESICLVTREKIIQLVNLPELLFHSLYLFFLAENLQSIIDKREKKDLLGFWGQFEVWFCKENNWIISVLLYHSLIIVFSCRKLGIGLPHHEWKQRMASHKKHFENHGFLILFLFYFIYSAPTYYTILIFFLARA